MKLRGLGGTISEPLATALAVSVAAHVAVYGLTPVMSLHVVARGGSSTDVGCCSRCSRWSLSCSARWPEPGSIAGG